MAMKEKKKPTKEVRRRRSRGNRREEIIRIAARLFASKGYHGISLDQIARQMNITKPALYLYIRNKEDILQEICRDCLVKGFTKWQKLDKTGLEPLEKFRLYIRSVIVSTIKQRDSMAVLFEDASALSPEVQDTVRRQRKAHDKELFLILKEGVDAGEFDIPDIKLTVNCIYGTCMWIYQWYNPDGRLTPDQLADQMLSFIEHGICRKKS